VETEILKIDANNIDMAAIRRAAEVLKSGGLVAFPTETVYGLGANALDPEAVKNIFRAKGRPSDNPLIVHISDKSQVQELVSYISPVASELMDKLWPGPLTLIMPRSKLVPDAVTAGLDTVAVRMPSHPVAAALIREAAIPVAAPSANISGRPSPTNALHVIEDLSGRVEIIIDSDSSAIGLESTVLDMSVSPPAILRPGGVTIEQLKEILGKVNVDQSCVSICPDGSVPRSPGMKYNHYSPRAEVIIVQGSSDKVAEKINSMLKEYALKGLNAGVLATDQTVGMYKSPHLLSAGDRNAPDTIAAKLFWSLRELDRKGLDIILAEAVESTGIGLAIMNRLSKAAGFNIIKV
jgi:L-threonylcarbamoyladenylate synthase